jgi:hypothetical protein
VNITTHEFLTNEECCGDSISLWRLEAIAPVWMCDACRLQRRQSSFPSHLLIVGLAAIFGVAIVVLGGPQLPTARPVAPTLSDIEIFLWSPSRVQIAGVLAILDWAIWLCWGYVLATTVLRTLVLVAERVAIGAAWVRSFRWVSDQIDAPKEMQSAWPKHSR